MYCIRCGNKCLDTTRFCPKCGAALNVNNAVMPSPGAAQANGSQQYVPPVQQNVAQQYVPPIQQNVGQQYVPPIQQNVGQLYAPPIQQNVGQQYTPPIQQNADQQFAPPVKKNEGHQYVNPVSKADEDNEDNEDDEYDDIFSSDKKKSTIKKGLIIGGISLTMAAVVAVFGIFFLPKLLNKANDDLIGDDRVELFTEGKAVAKYGNKYVIINSSGNIVKENMKDYDNVGSFEAGVAVVQMGNYYGLIDTDGNEVLSPSKYSSIGRFKEGIAVVEAYNGTSSRYGLIDKFGDVIKEPTYYGIGEFKDGIARVRTGESSYNYIDQKGEILFPQKYFLDALDFSDGIAAVKMGDEYTYINISGEKINENLRLYSAYSFVDGYAVVEDNDSRKYGLINKNGDYVLPAVYDSIYYPTSSYSNHYDGYNPYFIKKLKVIQVRRGSELKFMNFDGTVNFSVGESNADVFSDVLPNDITHEENMDAVNDLFPVRIEGYNKTTYKYVDTQGNVQLDFGFSYASYFINDVAICGDKDAAECTKYGILKINGEYALEGRRFDNAKFDASGKYIIVSDGGYSGLVAVSEPDKFIVDPAEKRFKEIVGFNSGLSVVSFPNGTYGYINGSAEISGEGYKAAKDFTDDGYAVVSNGEKWFIIDTSCNQVGDNFFAELDYHYYNKDT